MRIHRSGTGAGRIVFTLAVVLVCGSLSLPASSHAGDSEKNWGIGWAQGITLRKCFGSTWELGISGAPQDYLSNEDEYESPPDLPAEGPGYLAAQSTTRRESGWARFTVARHLLQRDRLSLAVYSGLKYNWRDGQTTQSYYQEFVSAYTREVTDEWTDEWRLILAARPSYAIRDNVTIEIEFGLSYAWQDEEVVIMNQPADSAGETIRRRFSESSSFSTYRGWEGLNSLNIIIWF
ncbi:MAG: hypothetical protein ABIF77_00610 [bacterium]